MVKPKRLLNVLILVTGLTGAGWLAAQPYPDEELRRLLINAINTSSSFQDRFDAEVWLMDMSHRLRHRINNPQKRLRFLKLVHHEASRAGLKPELVLSVIQVESNFDRFAISHAGARGLMQIMPFWLKAIGRADDNLFNPATNLRYGCTILKHYLKKERGNLRRALARYNGSLNSNRYPNLVFGALRKHWYAR